MSLHPFSNQSKLYASRKAWGHEVPSEPECHPQKSKVITIEDLPTLSWNSVRTASALSAYFIDFIREHQALGEYSFLLPSLESLSESFNLEKEEVQKTFHYLRLQGYDSFASGYYGHISLWTKPAPDGRQGLPIAFINSRSNLPSF